MGRPTLREGRCGTQPDLCDAHAELDKVGDCGLTTGYARLGLPTFVHHRLGRPISAATSQYTFFFRL